MVLATDANTLSEDAYAYPYDKYSEYWENSNLSAWKIKYCLDNDNTRFEWADTSNGKGVIYWMRDEYGNEAGYDFKNILFARKGYRGTDHNASTIIEGGSNFSIALGHEPSDIEMIGTYSGSGNPNMFDVLPLLHNGRNYYCYTFNTFDGSDNMLDASVFQDNKNFPFTSYKDTMPVRNNKIEPHFKSVQVDVDNLRTIQCLPNIVITSLESTTNYIIHDNYFSSGCFDITASAEEFSNNRFYGKLTNAYLYGNKTKNNIISEIGSIGNCFSLCLENSKVTGSIGTLINLGEYIDDITIYTSVVCDGSVDYMKLYDLCGKVIIEETASIGVMNLLNPIEKIVAKDCYLTKLNLFANMGVELNNLTFSGKGVIQDDPSAIIMNAYPTADISTDTYVHYHIRRLLFSDGNTISNTPIFYAVKADFFDAVDTNNNKEIFIQKTW